MSSITTTSDIFVKNADLKTFIVKEDKETKKQINETVEKQLEVLKLKELDKEKLRMVVQM